MNNEQKREYVNNLVPIVRNRLDILSSIRIKSGNVDRINPSVMPRYGVGKDKSITTFYYDCRNDIPSISSRYDRECVVLPQEFSCKIELTYDLETDTENLLKYFVEQEDKVYEMFKDVAKDENGQIVSFKETSSKDQFPLVVAIKQDVLGIPETNPVDVNCKDNWIFWHDTGYAIFKDDN